MTVNHHTPIANGAAANASTIENPLAQLDEAITNIATIEKDGHIIQEEGVDLTQQQRLNFVGASVKAENDAGNNATKVTIDGSNWGVDIRTLSGTLALADTDDPIQVLDPGGANRVVTLPAVGVNNHIFVLVNADPTYTIDVQKAGAVSLFTLTDDVAREAVPDKSADWYASGGSAAVDASTSDYTFSLSLASNNLTIALKRYDGTDPSVSQPLDIRIGNAILSITSALSVTITAAMGDIFTLDSRKIQGYDCQLFVYLINNNGTPQLGAAVNPNLQTVASPFRDGVGQTGTVTQNNIVMSGTRNATNTCAVIGRVNAQQLDDNSWWTPTVNNIFNGPIYETDWLYFLPVYTGFSSSPSSPLLYKLRKNEITVKTEEIGAGGTSNAADFTITLPFSCSSLTAARSPIQVLDNSAFRAANGWTRIPASNAVVFVYRDTMNVDNFTTSGSKGAYGSFDYLAFN